MKRAIQLIATGLALLICTSGLFACGKEGDKAKELYESAIADDGLEKPAYNGEKLELNVLNWGDYMDLDVLKAFAMEYPNIQVNYETMASNEEMFIQLQSGSIYDICFPSDYIIQRMIELDLIQEIDHSRLPHLANIDERFMDIEFDPGNKYSIPYMWGTLGILYNTTMVDDPVDSWGILWNEKYAKNIIMYDSVRDSFTPALALLGYDINTTDDAQIKEAETLLIEQKPLVLAYGQDDIRSKMEAEEAALSVVYSGDAIASIAENPDLAYIVPKEEGNFWYDNVVITKESKNIDAAYIFIDYLMRAQIAKVNTEFIGYSTPNKAAFDLLDESLQNDPVYMPPQDVIDRLEIHKDLGEYMQVYNEAWLRVKAS